MNCKDCIYFKRCVGLGVELDIQHDKDANKNCRHFKDKTNVVEVVHGKWERSDKKYSYYQYKCSNCDCDDYTQTDRQGICKLMNYCPNCGAKMDKE